VFFTYLVLRVPLCLVLLCCGRQERKAGRWGHGAAAALAALYVSLLYEVHGGGHALLDLRPGALGLYSKGGPGNGPKGATNNEWAMKVVDARGAVPLTAYVDVDTYLPAQPLFMAPEVARGNRPPPKKQTAEELETVSRCRGTCSHLVCSHLVCSHLNCSQEAARAKMKALTGMDNDQTSAEEDERRMKSTKEKVGSHRPSVVATCPLVLPRPSHAQTRRPPFAAPHLWSSARARRPRIATKKRPKWRSRRQRTPKSSARK
jgi:hypothetical protein